MKKIFSISVTVILLYAATGFFLVPYLIKKNAQEEIERVAIDDLEGRLQRCF